jgi:hypothetical protein
MVVFIVGLRGSCVFSIIIEQAGSRRIIRAAAAAGAAVER